MDFKRGYPKTQKEEARKFRLVFMETWIEDIVEQICVSRILMDSKTISGRRLSFIIADNSIEFMLKAYGDTRLVGTVIKKKDWENLKSDFNKMLSFVATHSSSKFSVDPKEIVYYHWIRNTLYHGALPLSVEPQKILDYLDKAIILLSDLLNVKPSKKELNAKTERVRIAIRTKEMPKLVEFVPTQDGLIKMQATVELSDKRAIPLVIYGFTTIVGKCPTDRELEKSLSYSGHPISPKGRLAVYISQLRKKKIINRGELSLTGRARRSLKKLYFMPQV